MEHLTIDTDAGPIHAVTAGEGPLVLLVHGFPESHRSWRHQLPALAAAGYRAVAIDVRGYGGSLRPAATEAYRMVQHVADNVAVVHALGARTAAIAGHDWGSPIAAASAQLRPDVFTAAALLGVPHSPRPPMRPTEAFAQAGGDEEFYVSYFQEPGRAEQEIEPDVRGWLRGFFLTRDPRVFTIPPGGRMRDRFPDPATTPLPDWLTEADLDGYAQDLGPSATGALSRYRNVDRDWEDLAAFDGLPLAQPAVYIAGAQDPTVTWMQDAIAAHPQTLPGLRGNLLLDGAGHWIQQERPDEVNRLLIDLLVENV